MKIVRTKKELKKIWEPILEGWLKEYNITDSKFNLAICPNVETPYGGRGGYSLLKNLIWLAVGSNQTEDIKFCFFHEIGHYQQGMRGVLDISIVTGEGTKVLEYDANKFVMDLGIRPTEFTKEHFANWNFYFGDDYDR